MPRRPPEKKVPTLRQAADTEKEFLKTFKSLTYKHRAWDVWNDFIVMAACLPEPGAMLAGVWVSA